MSAKQLLPDALAHKVDSLIDLLDSNPAMTRQQRNSAAMYGKMPNMPDYLLNQGERAIREFIQKTDQDIGWQCDTVTEAFAKYRDTGQIPAPHYAMRIAVLLRKAREYEREQKFLAAWCRHFPKGLGATYGKLVERACKVEAWRHTLSKGSSEGSSRP